MPPNMYIMLHEYNVELESWHWSIRYDVVALFKGGKTFFKSPFPLYSFTVQYSVTLSIIMPVL